MDAEYRYTPQERGQVLAFAWWVYANKHRWPREKLRAAITAISPLMLFSSSFFAEMTGLPRSTATKAMIKPLGTPISRVTGTCDPRIIQELLQATTFGLSDYREAVRELTLDHDVPKALMARISGVPRKVLLRPDRGVQFFPEVPDYTFGQVCGQQQYLDYLPAQERTTPRPGDQSEVRVAMAGTCLAELVATSAPLPAEGSHPFFTKIPGLPALRDAEKLGPIFYERVRDWESRYQLPAKIFDSQDASKRV